MNYHKTSFPLIAACLLTWIGLSEPLQAQRYRLTSGEVSFFSTAPLEDIEASNTQAQSIFDVGSGEIAFIIPIKKFTFEKSLMQEHFNENYLESDQYPNATFEGVLEGFQPDVSEPQQVIAQGKLTIHGVTHTIKVPGTVHLKGDRIAMDTTFPVKLKDYKIKIPQVVFYNIAEEVEVTVNFVYETEKQ